MDRVRAIWTTALFGQLLWSTVKTVTPPWRQDQIHHHPVSYHDSSLHQLCQMMDLGRLNNHLDHILVPRPVGSDAHENVATYIQHTLHPLGYSIEHDTFTRQTPTWTKTFTNIIATLDPSAQRRLILACHYDSKDMQTRYGYEFWGATDSAFPCSLLLDIAEALAPYIGNREATNVTLQLIFFDGEEAFGDWSPRDSLQGSTHLANIWQGRAYPSYESQTFEIDRIDLLVLLDLLGSAGPRIPNFVKINDRKAYVTFSDIERDLRGVSDCLSTSFPNNGYIFTGRESVVIDDDHIPFFRKGVPVIQLLPLPFPSVWHTRLDDRSALNDQAMTNLANIVRVFVARYLGIRL